MDNDQVKRRIRNRRLGIPRESNPPVFRPDTHIITGEGVLAGDGGRSLDHWLASHFNHNFDQYDRAIDAVYNDTLLGGSRLHHLLDAQHSVWGAFHAAHGVSSDDGWATELGDALEHLARDTVSVSGVNPFFSLSPDQFNTVGSLVSHLGVSKAYLADALTVNGSELLGGAVALVSAIIIGRRLDPNRLSRLGGGCLLSAVTSANPVLLPIAAGAMVYAVSHAEDRKTLCIQAGKGALVSGSAILVSTLVGGPFFIGCVAAMMAGTAVSCLLDDPERAVARAKELIRPAVRVLHEAAPDLQRLSV